MRENARSVSHSGQCDEDVEELIRVPAIARQLSKIDKDLQHKDFPPGEFWRTL